MRAFLLLVAVSGCGRVAFDSRGDAGIDAVGCPAGYTLEATGSCYRTYTAALTWFAAEAACEADGAHLVVVDDAVEAAVVGGYLPGATDFAWVGGTDQVTEGSYVTVLNQPAGYLQFETGEPDGALEDCLVLVADGRLSDNVCTGMDDYICEYDGKRAVSVAWGACPARYTFEMTGCYRVAIDSEVRPWLAAEADCEADGAGAHLVVIDSTAEAVAVDAIVPGTIIEHYIGVSDRVQEGVFLTVTNQPITYALFAAGEPNGGTAENCLVFDDARELFDRDCSDMTGIGDDYVCEYDGIPAVPAAYGR